MAIEQEFFCFDCLSTLNIVVSDLTDSRPLLRSAVLVATVWSSIPVLGVHAGELLDEPGSKAKGAG